MKAKNAMHARKCNRQADGSTVLVMLVFLSAMIILVVANATTLHWTKRELLRIEAQHLKQQHGSRPSH